MRSAGTVLAAVRATGLLEADVPVLVLLSGGRDSTCLLDLAVRLSGGASALHVNYGLRPDSDADEAHCRALCAQLDVPLAVEHPRRPDDAGNLQAWARDVFATQAAEIAALQSRVSSLETSRRWQT